MKEWIGLGPRVIHMAKLFTFWKVTLNWNKSEQAMKQLVEWELAGETEVIWENLTHKSHMSWYGIESRPLLWEVSDQPPELWDGP
jgi:hypothetical protein